MPRRPPLLLALLALAALAPSPASAQPASSQPGTGVPPTVAPAPGPVGPAGAPTPPPRPDPAPDDDAATAPATAPTGAEAGDAAAPTTGADADFRDELTDAGALLGQRIDRLQFRGNRKVEDDAIRANLLTRVGGELDLDRIREDVRSIWKLGFFRDVQVEATPSGSGGVTVIFAVEEKLSVRKILVSGNEELELEKLNEVIDLKRDAILDITKVKQNRQKVHDLYVEKGFYLAKVDYEIREVNEAEVDVWFVIDERSKVEIREVSFIGNTRIPDAELASVIATRKGGALGFLTDAGIYKEEDFERDLLIITAYYYDRGFINVKLGNPQIRLSRDNRYMYLSIPIDEGPVFSIGTIDFQGDLIGPKADYYERLTVARGEIFNRSKVGEDINRLNDYYKDRGYAYVNVTPVTNVDLEKRIVGLSFQIEKGKQVFFERINVRGNGKTRDKVIRREMKISEGELYNQTNLDTSKRRIQALGFFETVNVSTERGSSDEFVEVNVEVAERPTGTFQIGAGFSSVENFIAQAQISQNNLFGRGQTLALQAQLSSLRQLFLLRFVEPYFLDTEWTFAFDLFNQSRAFGSFARNASGASITLGYPLSYEVRTFLTYKLEDITVSTGRSGFANLGAVRTPVEAQSVANLFRGGLSSSLRASVSYDSRDDRLYKTTAGWYHNAFFEVAEEILGSDNIFVRYGGFSRYYKRLFGPFVLKLNGEVGVTTSRDPLGVPITERYLLGGIYDIRGFAPRSLGPKLRVAQPGDVGQPLGELPLGGNLQVITNSEVEFPLFERVGISGVVFFDSGNSYNLEERYCGGSAESSDISPKFDPCFRMPESLTQGLRYSVGFGFRWFSPIGPLRFEWGIPLDRQPGEDPLVFEFTIGNFF